MKHCTKIKETRREGRATLELRCVRALGHVDPRHQFVWFVKSGKLATQEEAAA